MKCIGRWCPKSLDAINTPGFVKRGGIIPYIQSAPDREGSFILGIKAKNKITDFGGGCKLKQNEKPLDCANREFIEETYGVINVDPANITHILVSGTKQPHQVILLIKVDDIDIIYIKERFRELKKSAKPQPEINNIIEISPNDLLKMDRSRISDSIYSILEYLKNIHI